MIVDESREPTLDQCDSAVNTSIRDGLVDSNGMSTFVYNCERSHCALVAECRRATDAEPPRALPRNSQVACVGAFVQLCVIETNFSLHTLSDADARLAIASVARRLGTHAWFTAAWPYDKASVKRGDMLLARLSRELPRNEIDYELSALRCAALTWAGMWTYAITDAPESERNFEACATDMPVVVLKAASCEMQFGDDRGGTTSSDEEACENEAEVAQRVEMRAAEVRKTLACYLRMIDRVAQLGTEARVDAANDVSCRAESAHACLRMLNCLLENVRRLRAPRPVDMGIANDDDAAVETALLWILTPASIARPVYMIGQCRMAPCGLPLDEKLNRLVEILGYGGT